MKFLIIIFIFVALRTRPSLTRKTCGYHEVLCNRNCIWVNADCESDITIKSDKQCAPNEFQCNNSKCILKSFLCDAHNDCDDGADEKNCLPTDLDAACLSREFACDKTRCIPKRSQCDGLTDCMDASDEIGCRPANITKSSEYAKGLNLGDTLELTCEASGVPVPIITWRFGTSHVPDQCTTWTNNGVGKLTCPNMQPEHKGFYFCEALVRDKSTIDANGTGVYVSVSQDFILATHQHCVLPDNPANGNYTTPGRTEYEKYIYLEPVFLNYTCNNGYKLIGSPFLFCREGLWSGDPPKCVPQCPLRKHPSIVYRCLAQGPLRSLEDDQECEDLVPDGATVQPECREPIYHYTGGFIHSTSRSRYDYGVLTLMHCVDGNWDYVPTCSPKCGLVTSLGDPLVINGKSAKRGELPWHAAIYRKTTKPYEQICGGSLISTTIIISAAHCFWSDLEKQLPPENYAAALGKLYRPWNDKNDIDVQKFNIREIKTPSRFRGSITNFQNDIAVLFTASAVEYSANVLPVCLNFDSNFERRQLALGKSGKVAGWGLTAEDGRPSPVLKVTALPYVDIDSCYAESPVSFHSYITSDKFCSGYQNSTGSSLCKGDSGGGLAFPSRERSEERYYLRGIVSTAPSNDHACNTFVYTTFTQISIHRTFIEDCLNTQ